MYIFLCPKTFSLANSAGSLEGKFLKYYLGRKGIKAKLSNELWEAFCFRLMDKSGNKQNAEELITEQRGYFEPENEKRDNETHEEINAKRDYNNGELVKATKFFIERNWADIDIAITSEEIDLSKVKNIQNVNTMSLNEFYLYCMNDDDTREMLESFWIKNEADKYNGD
jgi:hypothetical protein